MSFELLLIIALAVAFVALLFSRNRALKEQISLKEKEVETIKADLEVAKKEQLEAAKKEESVVLISLSATILTEPFHL
jgi:uncharacterized protein (DUF342 family)